MRWASLLLTPAHVFATESWASLGLPRPPTPLLYGDKVSGVPGGLKCLALADSRASLLTGAGSELEEAVIILPRPPMAVVGMWTPAQNLSMCL